MGLTEEALVAVRLAPTLTAAHQAREALDGVPGLGAFEDVQFVAALLLTELVANAVRHADLGPEDEITVACECNDGVLRVEITDRGPGFFPLLATQGRAGRVEHGLHLVNVLADRWGFRRGTGSYAVWFELDLVPGRRPWRGREPVWLHV